MADQHSVTHERRITCFPSPKYSGLIKAYAMINEMSESQAGSLAIKCFIDSLPADQKMKLQKAANDLPNKKISKNSY